MATKKHGLGRGLEALLNTGRQNDNDAELVHLPIQQIVPGKYQPRRHWDEAALDELAESIRAQGIIQPLVVRSLGLNQYELIAGERRWRAAQKAQLDMVPAVIRNVDEEMVPAMALVENIQRKDLTPLEEAQALERLTRDFKLTHQQVADAVGRSRAAVSNLLRLLDLPDSIRTLLDAGKLEMGHARCLLTLPEDIAAPLARQAVTLGWSVRELERAAQRAQGQQSARPVRNNPERDADIAYLERRLSEHFATRVQLMNRRGERGKVVIHYHNLDELEGILDKARVKRD